MTYVVRINDTDYEVEVEKGQAEILSTTAVTAAPQPTPQVIQPAEQPVATPQTAVAGEEVVSPMPGTILDIKVNQGDTVNAGDTLLILEALKMENEIVAPRNGRVLQVITTKGGTVDTGDLLLTLE